MHKYIVFPYTGHGQLYTKNFLKYKFIIYTHLYPRLYSNCIKCITAFKWCSVLVLDNAILSMGERRIWEGGKEPFKGGGKAFFLSDVMRAHERKGREKNVLTGKR